MGDNDNALVSNMETWNNAIFAGIANYVDGVRIYRSTDGNTWTKVNDDGFGHVLLNDVMDFQSFNNTLFVSLSQDGADVQAPEIWKTVNGTDWVQSGADRLGHAQNTAIIQMAVFNGQLYTCTENAVDGAEIYRTADGINWNLVPNSAGGFGDATNRAVWSLQSFDGFLWAGTGNNNGAQVWRSPDGINWFKYFDYATTVPPRPLFTEVNNFAVFNNSLLWYAINVAQGAEILKRHTDAGEWLEISAQGLGDPNNIWFSQNTVINGNLIYFGARNQVTGAKLWYSADGIQAVPINSNGFGNVDNFAIYALTFKDYLYVGLSSGNQLKGCEIWRRYYTSSFGLKTKKLPDGQQNSFYSTNLQSTGGTIPYIYSIVGGSLPEGLQLDSKTGQISGTPTKSGDFVIVIQVQDSGKKQQEEQRRFALKIVAGASDNSLSSITILPLTGSDTSN